MHADGSAAGSSVVGVLVIGASHAGVALAGALRAEGYDRPITLVGAEDVVPYQRPPLTKDYLAGGAAADALALRPDDFYADNDIALLTGTRVTEVDHTRRAAVVGDRTLHYDTLALTVGARPRRLTVPGSASPRVLHLRDLADADRLAAALGRAGHVLVVGGGYIGLEAAGVVTSLGRQVTVVEDDERLLPRSASPAISQFLLDAHRRRGVRVVLGRRVTAIADPGPGPVEALLDDGSTIDADVVVVGIGAVPRVELATRLGLAVNRGIVVDALARTSDSTIVAAGDCTVFAHPSRPGLVAGLESVQNATDQARTAAATIVGADRPYDAVPWFWSDQADLKLQMAGSANGSDLQILRGDPELERFSVVHFRDGRLAAVESVNRPADYMACRRVLATGGSFDLARVAEYDVPLKNLAVPAGPT
ncbi:MAG: hypothetical protein ABS81_06490 [Pseudonocardia sp. SCN 72-86]|nr:MAG: hypothetical protein ABS81_06490 [Pseudonocardia sp. SCN 72-86]